MMSLMTALGTAVLYKLSAADVSQIAQTRDRRMLTGNTVTAGELVHGIVVKDWGSSVNLIIFPDGESVHWVTSCTPGTEPGQYVEDGAPLVAPPVESFTPGGGF